MCIQVAERYANCRCLYYKHQVDACSHYRRRGHEVRTREVLVGYACAQHASSALYRQPGARPRRQAREEYQNDYPLKGPSSESLVYAQIESSPQPATDRIDRSDNGSFAGVSFDADESWAGPVSHLTEHLDPKGVMPRWSPPIDVGDVDAELVDDPEVYGFNYGQNGDVAQGVGNNSDIGGFDNSETGDVGQAVGNTPDIGENCHNESEVQTPSTWTAPLGEIEPRHKPSPGGYTCPHHLLQSVAACPRECGWNVEQDLERGDATTEISSRRLHQLLKDSLIFAIANLSRSIGPTAFIQFSDPCRNTSSHTVTDNVQLDTLQRNTNPESSTSGAPQLPITNSDSLNQVECPSTATCHKKENEKRPSLPPCYLLIFLGFLTVIGSLLPGLWRASSRNDLSGGFTLAQYILGVGIFVVGSMVAIHSKTCECWKTHKPVDQVVGAGH